MKLIGHILLALAAIGCLFCTFAVVAFHRAAVEHFHSTNQKLDQLEKKLEASKANYQALGKQLQRIEAEQAAAAPAPQAPASQRQDAIAKWRAWWETQPKAPAP